MTIETDKVVALKPHKPSLSRKGVATGAAATGASATGTTALGSGLVGALFYYLTRLF